MIRKVRDLKSEIEAKVKNPVQRGRQTGFKCLDELYSILVGSFTIWHGSPAHGKSEVIFEMLVNRAEHGEKSAIYSPETGTPVDIAMELAHKYLRKQIANFNPMNEIATELEMYNALAWVDEHFIIIDDEEAGYSFQMICDAVEKYERENDCKIIHIMAEPYNELVHDMKDAGGRQDLYIEAFLTEARRYSRRSKKHVHLSFHTGQQQQQKVDNITFYPMPKAREAAGGQAGLRKAMTWINIWRPAPGLKNAHGQPYLPNEVLINVEKAKPKYISYRGTCSLYFDTVKNRYYEKINTVDCYAYDHLDPNKLKEINYVIEQQQQAFDFRVDTPSTVEEVEDLPF